MKNFCGLKHVFDILNLGPKFPVPAVGRSLLLFITALDVVLA